MEGASTNRVGSFAQRLANDCRRLAALEHEGSVAGLFEKLARLFDEAAAIQRCQAARTRGCGDEFDFWL
ncbi:MAG TPA: hypothetical protein VJO12_04965 [Stellaceae bacterium]|nr:hypothetical protein [Stellaceae bacterium]